MKFSVDQTKMIENRFKKMSQLNYLKYPKFVLNEEKLIKSFYIC